MLLNISDMPSTRWTKEELESVKEYGKILNISYSDNFLVPAQATDSEIESIAAGIYSGIIGTHIPNEKIEAVIFEGESTLTNWVISKLTAKGIKVLSCPGCYI